MATIVMPPAVPRGSSPHFNIISALVFLAFVVGGLVATAATINPAWLVAGFIFGIIASLAPKIAAQWERAVVLRLGRYRGLRGPGLFWIIPFIDSVTSWIDQRVMTTSFAAEETLTSDTVPVNVDAVLFWMVHNAEEAALEVQDYAQAVSWAAQTALRDIIGRTSLADLLRGRERIEAELQELIDQRSMPWGVTVQSVEMRDVIIPTSLQDAMSREAQASREKSARIILGQAEVEIAQLFAQAARCVPRKRHRAAPSRDEHPLRRPQGKGRSHDRAKHCGRIDGLGWPPGRSRRRPTDPGRLGAGGVANYN